jgi:hypothetical protein
VAEAELTDWREQRRMRIVAPAGLPADSRALRMEVVNGV